MAVPWSYLHKTILLADFLGFEPKPSALQAPVHTTYTSNPKFGRSLQLSHTIELGFSTLQDAGVSEPVNNLVPSLRAVTSLDKRLSPHGGSDV